MEIPEFLGSPIECFDFQNFWTGSGLHSWGQLSACVFYEEGVGKLTKTDEIWEKWV